MKLEEIQSFFKENISYKDWEFHIKDKNGVPYLQIQFMAPDNFTGKSERQYCRKWMLSEWMTPTELVETAWAAVQRAELHEAKENFKFKGKDVFNSHLNVEGLVALCNMNAYEHRPEQPKKIETKLNLACEHTYCASRGGHQGDVKVVYIPDEKKTWNFCDKGIRFANESGYKTIILSPEK